MAGFTGEALEKKLQELNNSQQSIQTLSLWLIHHRKHHKTIVQVWFKELKKAKASRKLTFMYLANDVIQNSKKKGPEFSKEFSTVLSKAFAHVNESVNEPKTKQGLERIINVWADRNVYDHSIISSFRAAMGAKSPEPETVKEIQKPKRKKIKVMEMEPIIKKPKEEVTIMSPRMEPPDAEDLIKALQDLENSPSTDAAVREKIAQLPPEVSDVSLLEKINNREASDKLTKLVEEASTLLTDYNKRLNEELEDRLLVSKMLSSFTHAQRQVLAETERTVGELREQLKRVTLVRTELKSHLQNLPDLTLLPSVTGGLAPLPSAGDLFQ
ncbi:regulation of nuclear pre-mRNA domain-containing protein 1B-like [Argiope bruennichi]|uniref:regulation of nuclear pre-mRNA domain-containing protein 1B-like n=1 Tax=Argiope bruennichi TaxID=94029 RepID=UPI0024951A6C|nr:regulation of nuclear pre-mRNA domain-containing protein 1B-like [Argiope bruennichi]XP_055950127.1 regulation of nuclear pre-mRNA domain-containing protein 1B-like [Argiope bruennichi]